MAKKVIGKSPFEKMMDGGKNKIDGKTVRVVSIDKISPDKKQPRKSIEPHGEDIKNLGDSIRKNGFIQLVTVRKSENEYIIVAGERRYHAAKVAGIKKIPVMVMDKKTDAKTVALLQVEENVQRKDLTVIEEANAYLRLKAEFGMTQKEIAEMSARPKGHISKFLKIATLPEEIKSAEGVSARVLYDLACLSTPEILTVWDEIEKNPSIQNFEKAVIQKEEEKIEHKDEGILPEDKPSPLVLDVTTGNGKTKLTDAIEFLSEHAPNYLENLLSTPQKNRVIQDFEDFSLPDDEL